MRRLVAGAAVVLGALLVLAGLATALRAPASRSSAPAAVVAFAVVALAVGLWKVRGSLDASAASPVPWADNEPFADPPPEAADDEHPLVSDALARTIRDAGETARTEGTVEAGVAEVRPVLRATLLAALARGHRDHEAAHELVATGEWTDDPVAASVLDGSVAPPRRPLRARLRAWLFPERAVARRSRRAVQAVAEAADDALPTVPGQTAPRTVEVARPGLDELQRGADGTLRRATDREVVARGPEPPEATLETTASDPGADGRPPDTAESTRGTPPSGTAGESGEVPES